MESLNMKYKIKKENGYLCPVSVHGNKTGCSCLFVLVCLM